MRKLRIVIPLVLLAIVIAVGLAVWLRRLAPPEPARLLPQAQAFVYVNFKPLRRAKAIPKTPPVEIDPAEYEQFVRETGFEFDRDLDEAALAVHAAQGPDGENRYTEVLVGHFDATRISAFLRKLTNSVDSVDGVEVYNVHHENRIVRVALLGPDMVAISNLDDGGVIRGIVDRYRKLAMPFGGPGLLREYYGKVPLASLAWAIAQMSSPSGTNRPYILPGGFDLFFPPDTVLVGSVRYLGSIDLKAEAFTNSDEAAKRIDDQLRAFLALFNTLEANASGGDPDVKKFFDSIQVEQKNDQAILTAKLDKGFVTKLLSEPPPVPVIQPQPTPTPAPEQRKPSRRTHHQRN